jgi:hypothetical protein
MTLQKPRLPKTSWKVFLSYIKRVGENEIPEGTSSVDDHFLFLVDIGILSTFDSSTLELTVVGKSIFESSCIRNEDDGRDMLQQALLNYPPVTVLQQYLFGVKNISTGQVLTVLKSTGFWENNVASTLTHFLDLLNLAGIIDYAKRSKTLVIKIAPNTETLPRSIFINPASPFSNIVWIKRVLSECRSFIYWFDKHFQKEALEWLCSIADANNIQEIRILSLDLGEKNLTSATKKSFKRFKEELENRGILVTWATVELTLTRDTHDRWIIGADGYVKNIPNVNAIQSGQRSEVNSSENYRLVLETFNKYWEQSKEI